jgi:hypothetical protein
MPPQPCRACVKIFRQSAMIAGARLRSIRHPASVVPDAPARQRTRIAVSKPVVHSFTSREIGWPLAPSFTAMMQILFELSLERTIPSLWTAHSGKRGSCLLGDVAGSDLRPTWAQGVAGSNPVAPTNFSFGGSTGARTRQRVGRTFSAERRCDHPLPLLTKGTSCSLLSVTEVMDS